MSSERATPIPPELEESIADLTEALKQESRKTSATARRCRQESQRRKARAVVSMPPPWIDAEPTRPIRRVPEE